MDEQQTWYGSDVLLDQLARSGCDYIAMNPGATLRGLHDSLVNPVGPAPRMIVTLHEEIAVAIAHGYQKAAGRPMAVGLHDTVGLLHASMALFNAWVDRAPLLALVGTGPLDAAARRPWIDWVHTVTDQTALVREHAVLTDQPLSLDAAVASYGRAWRRLGLAPSGPAVLGIDVLLQEAVAEGPVEAVDPFKTTAVGPDPQAVTALTAAFESAAAPVLVVDRPLTEPAVLALLELSDRIGAGLIDLGGGSVVPVGRCNDVTESARDALAVADLVVSVDVRDPAWALGPVDLESRQAGAQGESVTTFHVGVVELTDRGWMATESPDGADHHVVGDPALVLEAVLDRIPSGSRAPHPAMRRSGEDHGAVPRDPPGLLHPQTVSATLRRELHGKSWTLAAGAMGGWARRGLRWQEPRQFLGRSGGEGLGYALGATIGAGLAMKGSGHIVMGLQGDGDLLYTPQALWTAAHHDIPVLIVIDNNGTYFRDELHQRAMARSRGRDEGRVGPGLVFEDPSLDFVGLARSQGIEAHGPVTTKDALSAALRAGIDAVSRGEPAVIDARTCRP